MAHDMVFPDAVSVRYAREQYALGYVHGRSDGITADDAAEFARRYVDECAVAGRLVDVERIFTHWQAGSDPVAQLALFG